MTKIDVKKALDTAKDKGEGMLYFGVIGVSESYDVEQQLKALDVKYQKTAVKGEYDQTPYDIYADVNTYK